MSVLGDIVGDSPGIRRLREQLETLLKRAATAPRPPAILLRGETGTGKGLVAGTMHRAGPRARGPFVEVNCAAIPENLLEAELFGYERGAFTDARQAKPGLFQLAHRGMLFLDEIGMLSPALQAKLLKVLEDGVVRRLGGTRAEPVDVWIISATNEDLTEGMRERRFREDLYHRLAVLSLELPPLRERGADVHVLAERFLARACADYGLPAKTFARDARAALAAYEWPGNVRELGNVIERVALLGDESMITAALLALPVTATVEDQLSAEPMPAHTSRDRMRAHLLEVLTETGGNISQTAARLGVARNTVLARMARFGLRTSAVAHPARSRSSDALRRDGAVTARTDTPTPLVATSRAVWEQRRVALLRVDVVVHAAAGSADTSRALDEMIGKVQTFGGDIVELGTGAFVAAFGLEAVEDAPVRAALAALAILKAAERARSDGAGPGVKIVVYVAHVLVSQHQGTGTIDLESKKAAWTMIQVLVDLDQLDTIVVSEASAPFLERRFELTPTSAGEASAVPFRCLTRREPTGFGLGGRPLSRFVGRDGEFRLVMDRLADAARGHGQVIGIVGEPGVGKSRFVYELTRINATDGWHVLRCGGVSHGSTTPLLPVSDLLRRYFAIEDADEPEIIREKVSETILSRHEELKPFLTPLLSLLDVAVDDRSWINLDPRRRRQRVQDAMKRLLLSESRIQPLLLLIEDLHWIDAETQAVLDSLVDSLPTARLLLVVTYRPEYEHRWGGKTYYSRLRLAALPPERAAELLHALLGDQPELEPLTRLLVKRGNPFFIEESIRALVETRTLVGERGAYRLPRPIEAIEVPATVEVILAARIERLSTDDKRLLQMASVIGKEVPVVLLHAVAEIAEEEVRRGLAHLQAAEFLYETRLSPDAAYSFKHALTHDVTYGTLLEDRRKGLHARIVSAIEQLYPDRLTEHVERLAHHAVRGELWQRAVTYLHQAGVKAKARSASREAASYLEQALTALGHLPESRQTLEQAIDLRVSLRGALVPLGAWQRIVDYLREAAGLAESLHDRRRRGEVSAYLCHSLFMTDRLLEAITCGEDAQALGQSLADMPLVMLANLYLGAACFATADYRRAEELLVKFLSLPEGEIDRNFAVTARNYLMLVCTDLGKFEEGQAHGEEALRLAEALGLSPATLAIACGFLGNLHSTRGKDLQHAVRVLERGVAVSREWNMAYFEVVNSGSIGYVYALMGRTAEGIQLLESTLHGVERMNSRFARSLYVQYLSEAYEFAGRLQEALELASRALTLARERGERGGEAKAFRLLGDVAAHRDSPEEAERHYRDALALAEELGMRPLVAHCHAGLGRVVERAAKLEEARQHFTTATTMYREMGMTYWLEKLGEENRAREGL